MARKPLRTGDLPHQITFERKVADGSFDGAGTESWQEVVTVWAQVQDVLPSRGERVADGFTTANRPARIRLRYRTDITSDMRIRFGARVMQIISGPAELGMKDGLELMAEQYQPAGGAS